MEKNKQNMKDPLGKLAEKLNRLTTVVRCEKGVYGSGKALFIAFPPANTPKSIEIMRVVCAFCEEHKYMIDGDHKNANIIVLDSKYGFFNE